MDLQPGRTLLHYRIVEKIGEGGMGEVYVAEDSKLGRLVALKVLPAGMADDETRRARFEREARAIAALNHPNIVTIFSVEFVSPSWQAFTFAGPSQPGKVNICCALRLPPRVELT